MILITYKTNTGTTKETAELIRDTLVKKNFEVELLELNKVITLDPYEAIIIGSPINGMQWLSEMSNFVKVNEVILLEKKVACFALSYIINDGRDFWKKRISNGFNEICDLIKPIDQVIFGGKIEEPMPDLARLVFGLSKESPLDYRNKENIIGWSERLVKKIR